MCGRFAQAQSREEYLAHLVEAAERDIAWDPAPIGRYNVAPGTKVLLLNERDEQLHLDAVYWGYAPGWWDKPPLINARVETTAAKRCFHLPNHHAPSTSVDHYFRPSSCLTSRQYTLGVRPGIVSLCFIVINLTPV
ncbi:TPA: SOS response-associated peptidase family protein [Klebsiella pneumoniae]